MDQTPSLIQLLKQAIDKRLLYVHTALIGRVESYDANTQLADIQPLLKRSIHTDQAQSKQEALPLLVDVPIIFPRAGGFFISLPVQPGDCVQVLFNETSIDEFLTEMPSPIASAGRFTLQGAVAIPGIYPHSRPLKDAHAANFVAGKDDGVQIHIDGEKIRLGSDKADEALAIASKVKEELEKIKSAFNLHSHPAHKTVSETKISPIGNIATKKVSAE